MIILLSTFVPLLAGECSGINLASYNGEQRVLTHSKTQAYGRLLEWMEDADLTIRQADPEQGTLVASERIQVHQGIVRQSVVITLTINISNNGYAYRFSGNIPESSQASREFNRRCVNLAEAIKHAIDGKETGLQ
ncbi:hypothetical protein C900_03919 [Fulvivirga imtechensis AK7]|uniref:Uncharacterized protein n=1 Tax=Fulvivirga imtechensis AK7 TaxID=1237149 RepID=L8JS03_9BACT|nr:hypothetical protein [Fulvivirga imtechensis]ELR70234.1 hypothetical protein C900_03919 [Fulvivirga imtechensis AK7]